MHARYATLSADNFPIPLHLNSSDLNESKTTLWKTLGGGGRPPSPPPLAAPLVSGHFVTAYPRNYTKQPVGQRLIMAHRANTKDTSHRTSSIIIMRSGGSCEDVESSVLSRQCRNTNCRNWKCYRGLVHVLLIKCCLMFREKGLGHSERNRFLSQLMKGLRLKR